MANYGENLIHQNEYGFSGSNTKLLNSYFKVFSSVAVLS